MTGTGRNLGLAAFIGLFSLCTCGVQAAGGLHDLTFAWNPNPEPDIAGYTLGYGTAHGQYTWMTNVGQVTTATLSALNSGVRYYFAVRAYNYLGLPGAYSEEVSYEFPPNAETNLITNHQAGSLRNNFTGWVGMKFTVGESPLTVSALGRLHVQGNTGLHQVKLVNAVNKTDVPGALVVISGDAGIAGQFTYGVLAYPISLSAHTPYYLVSQETLSGDFWYELDTTVELNQAGLPDGPVYTGIGQRWIELYRPGSSYGPVDLKFRCTEEQIEIRVDAVPLQGGVVTGGGEYPSDSTVTLSATANPGFAFMNWTDDQGTLSSFASFSFVAETSKGLIAHFSPAPEEPETDTELASRLVNGQFELILQAEPGTRLLIEVSTDLVTWIPLGILNLPSGADIVRPPRNNSSVQQYYRVVSQSATP